MWREFGSIGYTRLWMEQWDSILHVFDKRCTPYISPLQRMDARRGVQRFNIRDGTLPW
ncbi:MAG: hypothetical protein ACTSVY_01525 [Candidatus Helarchaeota archaeon]